MSHKTLFYWLFVLSGFFCIFGVASAAQDVFYNQLTLSEIMVSCGSFAQMIATLGAIPFLFIHRELKLSKRSWTIFSIGMATILVRRSLSIWNYMGYERATFGEMGVSAVLSLIYIMLEISVLLDTVRN